jgi:hypothetical protein
MARAVAPLTFAAEKSTIRSSQSGRRLSTPAIELEKISVAAYHRSPKCCTEGLRLRATRFPLCAFKSLLLVEALVREKLLGRLCGFIASFGQRVYFGTGLVPHFLGEHSVDRAFFLR